MTLKPIVRLTSRVPGVSRVVLSVTRPRRFLLLTFHRVNDEGHPFFGGTPVELFRRQMETLRRYFDVWPLGELVDRVRETGQVPLNAAAITFDDGYRDNFTHAFPVLRELGLPATIFLVTRALDCCSYVDLNHDCSPVAFILSTRAADTNWNVFRCNYSANSSEHS